MEEYGNMECRTLKANRNTMRNYILEKVEEYLNHSISTHEFVSVCRQIYDSIIESKDKYMQLDLFYLTPFIHEFAYFPYEERELEEQVEQFEQLLCGRQEYQYSTFVQILPPEVDEKLMYDLYLNSEQVNLQNCYQLFVKADNNPSTLKDLIYDNICDFVSKINYFDFEESDFDSVYCNEGISEKMLEDKLKSLLSYYLGIKPFYVVVNIMQDNQTVYVIS